MENLNFCQDSFSESRKNVLRGLHLQIDQWQLITVLSGNLLDISIDLRRSSNTYLNVCSANLDASKQNQLLIAPGIAHGYLVLSKKAIVHYKSTRYYEDTPQFVINMEQPPFKQLLPDLDFIVSDRDKNAPDLKTFLENRLNLDKQS